jgi:hypothetical protein
MYFFCKMTFHAAMHNGRVSQAVLCVLCYTAITHLRCLDASLEMIQKLYYVPTALNDGLFDFILTGSAQYIHI